MKKLRFFTLILFLSVIVFAGCDLVDLFTGPITKQDVHAVYTLSNSAGEMKL